MKIALITEAWPPQVNGVVTTWTHVTGWLGARGHEVLVAQPGLFKSVSCPGYPCVRLTLRPGRLLARMLDAFKPDAIHIATEGPLGLAGRRYCARRGRVYTTSYHTQFADYLKAYYSFPKLLTYRYLRWFHGGAARTLVPTASVKTRLEARGFRNIVTWCRGVDGEVFRPGDKSFLGDERPIFLSAGRVALEKNLEAFLKADLPGTKYVLGDGPALPRLKAKYPKARFVGYQPLDTFSRHMAAADVFVFPSRTDTFGLVMLEAMASGVPVAAYPVTGPNDVIRIGVSGVLHEDLREAALAALHLSPTACREESGRFTWDRCAEQVLENLAVR